MNARAVSNLSRQRLESAYRCRTAAFRGITIIVIMHKHSSSVIRDVIYRVRKRTVLVIIYERGPGELK